MLSISKLEAAAVGAGVALSMYNGGGLLCLLDFIVGVCLQNNFLKNETLHWYRKADPGLWCSLMFPCILNLLGRQGVTCILGLAGAVVYSKLLYIVPQTFPGSFTFGEACISSQLYIALWNAVATILLSTQLKPKQNRNPLKSANKYQKIEPTTVTNEQASEEESAQELKQYSEIQTLSSSKTAPSKNDINPDTRKNSCSPVSTATRKYFHLAMLLVYFPGLVFHPKLLYLASVVATGVLVLIEKFELDNATPTKMLKV
ncbi:hypothetical protein MAR_024568 [Mya arenaria]|uniref:dolichol kinase n=1 Tax=Mya arenaria TaxID=6604 RepID=A0ABY7DV53_MYAAR|nr:hypothetical protein MAR_024568 [Mya arenaria]